MDNLEMLVVGAGAVGIYFAGRIAQSGMKVSVVARGDYDVLQSNGGVYRIEGSHGDFTFKPERILKSVSEMPVKPDFILVALKIVPGADPVELCRPAVGRDSAFFVIQNGLGSEEALAAAYPENEIIGAIAYIGASRPEPGVVRQQDACKLRLGVHPKGVTAKAKLLQEALSKNGVDAALVEDIVLARWSKLTWNAPYNPISVLGNHADTHSIMHTPEGAALAEAVMREVAAVAKAAGHELPPGLLESQLDFTRGMSPYKTSMLQDFEAGRPLEIEAILGQPLKVAERYGVDVPVMRTMHSLLTLVARDSARVGKL